MWEDQERSPTTEFECSLLTAPVDKGCGTKINAPRSWLGCEVTEERDLPLATDWHTENRGGRDTEPEFSTDL
jgi:hypothetical protein